MQKESRNPATHRRGRDRQAWAEGIAVMLARISSGKTTVFIPAIAIGHESQACDLPGVDGASVSQARRSDAFGAMGISFACATN
jgi:hypothetical protein